MTNDTSKQERYYKAKKRVEKEKGFYGHLTVYIVINMAIVIIHRLVYLNIDKINPNHDFTQWLNWNLLLTPVLWGIGLLIHGLCVFKKDFHLLKRFKHSVFSKEWEENKIKELIDKDDF
ncbi:2TM domain-containing protein [Aquimarina mytili]|uniref:2TM domain-containing protein n=1 Tax=Aquimarina mytili TaxID=874423 RepID=A0A936ZY07_9FLAO|nr:2TM domain-containing protein [Aquimarina mytili]MBL0684381.1 2TM domain-containing protein [Aquimarina mytili]